MFSSGFPFLFFFFRVFFSVVSVEFLGRDVEVYGAKRLVAGALPPDDAPGVPVVIFVSVFADRR